MKKIPIYILSGGKSARFGTDKARAEFNNKTLLNYIADSLKPAAKSITVVADQKGKYDDLDFRTIEDIHKGLGPLSGLHTALEDLDDNWLMLTSCDLVGIKIEWIHFLFSHIQNNIKAVAFRGNIWEPMPALYHSKTKEFVEEIITKKGTLWHLFEKVETVSLPYPVDWTRAVNINTVNDLKKFNDAQKLHTSLRY